MPCGAVVAEQAVVVGLQRVEAAAHQHRREWRFALLRHVQETGDAAAAFDAKLQLFQLIRQQQRRLFVSAIGEHLRLFGQLVALQVRVTGDAVQARGLQPVFAAEQRILLLRRPLLPLHALMDPFVDPVAVAVAHHGIQPLRIAALGVRGGDARQHFVDFDRADAAPCPQQRIQYAVPAAGGVAFQRGMHGGAHFVARAQHQRRGFRVFEFRLEKNFRKVGLCHGNNSLRKSGDRPQKAYLTGGSVPNSGGINQDNANARHNRAFGWNWLGLAAADRGNEADAHIPRLFDPVSCGMSTT